MESGGHPLGAGQGASLIPREIQEQKIAGLLRHLEFGPGPSRGPQLGEHDFFEVCRKGPDLPHQPPVPVSEAEKDQAAVYAPGRGRNWGGLPSGTQTLK